MSTREAPSPGPVLRSEGAHTVFMYRHAHTGGMQRRVHAAFAHNRRTVAESGLRVLVGAAVSGAGRRTRTGATARADVRIVVRRGGREHEWARAVPGGVHVRERWRARTGRRRARWRQQTHGEWWRPSADTGEGRTRVRRQRRGMHWPARRQAHDMVVAAAAIAVVATSTAAAVRMRGGSKNDATSRGTSRAAKNQAGGSTCRVRERQRKPGMILGR
ncbi:hypothetical protein GGX14DRAFT_397712 [Mycena pura]|uniref:Uncharacterized protein n=1 Tax=Mycena pura TaxID=153505 RepID=A0AAD6V7G4_9AGAR|nr:hypothetical protein GGX14DRAFT_397712 [Mycena pura]